MKKQTAQRAFLTILAGLVVLSGYQARLLWSIYGNDKFLYQGTENRTAHVETAYHALQDATEALFSAEQAQSKSHDILTASREELISILISRIEPSILLSQDNSSARLQAALSAAAEAKSFGTMDVSDTNLDASPSRFDKAVDAYAELSHTRRARQWAEDAKTLFEQCMIKAQALLLANQKTQEALNRFIKTRATYDTAVRESRFSGVSTEQGHLFMPVWLTGLVLVFSWLLLGAGVFFVIRLDQSVAREILQPLQDIVRCVEAAATGDVSRVPGGASQTEIGKLSSAAGRLIKVLARSESLVYHLAALVESSGEAIISHNLEGIVLSWNKGAQRIYGYSPEDMKGRSIAELSPYDHGAELKRVLIRIRQGDRIQPFETLHQASNGRAIHAFVRVSPILDSTRRIIGASFCAQDLTETELLRFRPIEESQSI